MRDWHVSPQDAGIRLDKYLAAPDRAGSRARAFAALERGKVFVNDREMSAADAGARLAAGDAVRLWMDRPGSAKRRASLGDDRDLPIVYEDDALVVLNKTAVLLAPPLASSSVLPSRRSWSCGSCRAAAIRSGFRRACAGIRSSASSGISMDPIICGRLRFRGRRCTRCA